jgi:Putative undecaprenyl diphosphate synthase
LVGYRIGKQQQQQHLPQASSLSKQSQFKQIGGRRAEKEIDKSFKNPIRVWNMKGIIQAVSCFISRIHFIPTSLVKLVCNLLFSIREKKNTYKRRPRSMHVVNDCWPQTTRKVTIPVDSNEDADLKQREDVTRMHLQSNQGEAPESGISQSKVPRHVAVIMDGNRRYGKSHYGSASRGHWEGSSKLVEFAKWCLAEKIQVLTVFAFSSENWNRDPAEVASLMQIFAKYCDELREEAIKRDIKILALSTDEEKVGNLLWCTCLVNVPSSFSTLIVVVI